MEAGGSRAGPPRIGGHAVLDLANTVRWRLDPDRRDDVLRSFTDAARFAHDVGLVSAEETATVLQAAGADEGAARAELEKIKELREAVHAAVLDHGPTGSIAEAYREAIAASELRQVDGSWTWVARTGLLLVRHRIALASADLLTSPEVRGVRQCADAHCGWIYLDRSPRRNRRWCSSSDCGNRNRVREHYQRSRATATADSDAADHRP